MKIKSLNILAVFLILSSILSVSCEKDENVKSKPTFWPNIIVNGDEFVIVPVGTTYEDASATVTVNGAPIPFETESDVDDSEVGAYTVTYTAENEDGISASATRTVIVVDEDALDDDLTGTYQRSTNVPRSVWAKDPDKLYTYTSNNPGGVNNNPPFNIPFTIYNVAPGIVCVPTQSFGSIAPFYCTTSAGGSKNIPFNTSAAVGQTAYAWFLNGPNFSAVVRTFVKR